MWSLWNSARQVWTRQAWHLYSESVHPASNSAGIQTSDDALGSRVEITLKSNPVFNFYSDSFILQSMTSEQLVCSLITVIKLLGPLMYNDCD